MPRKKVRKEKTRTYLEDLLDKEGLTDRDLIRSIIAGTKSDNATERSKAVEIAARLKGFSDVDKKGDEVERLPIGNISLEDLDRLANRCAYCKHGQFVPVRGSAELAEVGKVAGGVIVPGPMCEEMAGKVEEGGYTPGTGGDIPEVVGGDSGAEGVSNAGVDSAAGGITDGDGGLPGADGGAVAEGLNNEPNP